MSLQLQGSDSQPHLEPGRRPEGNLRSEVVAEHARRRRRPLVNCASSAAPPNRRSTWALPIGLALLALSPLLLDCLHLQLVRLASARSVESAPTNLSADEIEANAEAKSLPTGTPDLHERLLKKITSIFAPTPRTPSATSTPTWSPPTDTSPRASEASTSSEQDGATGAGDDDNDAEDCQGISGDESEEGRRLTDNERLVNLQACLQGKVKRKLAGATRAGMELFERLSLSGGCAGSLMHLTSSLVEIKSFAFKFIDASAKVPSGVMFGLLSDFGDFDQCLSIRSDPHVPPQDEVEERAYSGKYCLATIRLNYRVQLGPNASAPEGIYPDGVLWDEMVRNYWTSKSTKGFQVGVCVPSRCTDDDLSQIYQLLAKSYNFQGEIMGCQDSNDLRRQLTPDLLQRLIIYDFACLLALCILGTFVERYRELLLAAGQSSSSKTRAGLDFAIKLLSCFSLRCNWRIFMSLQDREMVGPEVSIERERRPNLGHQAESLERNLTGAASDGDSQQTSCASSTDAQIEAIHQQLSVKILPLNHRDDLATDERPTEGRRARSDLLSHLSGMKLLVIIWITVGHSFLYPSANNYQYYRSIINMNITRDSVWFAATNFTLGIDMLLYMIGLAFVFKLAGDSSKLNELFESATKVGSPRRACKHPLGLEIVRQLFRKILHFWPTYLAVISLAIVVPLLSDGPMWPEMVSHRLAGNCRANWWANLLMINNFLSETSICLPSSWFISVMMQCLLVGSAILLIARRWSLGRALVSLAALLVGSSLASFLFAYELGVRAPAIRMDETFVLEIDDTIYRLYTSTFNNLGPFLVGMLGGLALIEWRAKRERKLKAAEANRSSIDRVSELVFELNVLVAVALVGVLVLSSVFHRSYTRFWASIYWSCHRVGWAIVTGYIVHQCATGRWKLLKDLLSLSSLTPISRLIFIAYLVYPMFIHIHSGLVRDGLHVSIYNMLNIYITRLVMTFATALTLHLLVELPFCSVEELLLNSWLRSSTKKPADDELRKWGARAIHPLLSVAPIVSLEPPQKTTATNVAPDLAAAEEMAKARG